MGKKLGDVASNLYRDGQEAEAKSAAASLGLGYADLRKTYIPNEVLSHLSRDEAIANKAIPLKTTSGKLFLGMVDPKVENPDFFNALKRDYKLKEIQKILISEQSYLDWLTAYSSVQKMSARTMTEDEIDITKVTKIASFESFDKELQTAPIQELLKMILSAGFGALASDIHIEPHPDKARIRFRLDGVLHQVATLSRKNYDYFLSQVELHSSLKLNADYPQNGRFSIKLGDKDLGVRIETVPSLHGDDIVLRLFNIEAELLDITKLGLSSYHLPLLKEALMRPHGMLLVSGPTGSGKTSTIYAILNELNHEDVKIITLEDPVEYELRGITQSQIKEGDSFAERLKAILREDPDIIMVGEIRDSATAETALQAALTGHLLISSIHANNSVTSITRLVEMIGDPTLVTATTNIIIAQRLVRKICSNCKKEYQPNAYETHEINEIMAKIPEEIKPQGPLKFFRGEGCDKCFHVGLSGRIGIFEILHLDSEMQKLISAGAPISDLQETARKAGMITMEEDGLLKALEGVTTIGDVLKTVRE